MFKGVFTPIITAFDRDGRIDYPANRLIINRLIDGGVNGILFMGSIGEFFALSYEEKKEFIRFAVQTVDHRVKVLIGTGGTVPAEVKALTRFAESEGADAAVIISPYYFKLDDESLYRYYSSAAASVRMPVLLYNFPDRTCVSLDPPLIRRLAHDCENIVGIKDTVDTISHTRKIIAGMKQETKAFSVFSGFDEYFLPNLTAGGSGIITGLTNIAPHVFTSLYSAYHEKRLDAVAMCQSKINRLMEIYDVSTPFISAIKAAVALLVPGIGSAPRQPFAACDDSQTDRIKVILRDAGIM